MTEDDNRLFKFVLGNESKLVSVVYKALAESVLFAAEITFQSVGSNRLAVADMIVHNKGIACVTESLGKFPVSFAEFGHTVNALNNRFDFTVGRSPAPCENVALTRNRGIGILFSDDFHTKTS